jgi:hypothetical protein
VPNNRHRDDIGAKQIPDYRGRSRRSSRDLASLVADLCVELTWGTDPASETVRLLLWQLQAVVRSNPGAEE